MEPTTIGRYLINKALPEEYRDINRVLDGKTANKLLSKLAMERPDDYGDILFGLNQIAVDAHTSRGGLSPSVKHFRESAVWKKRREELRKEFKRIYADPKLSIQEKRDAVTDRLTALSPQLTKEVFDEADAAGNPLAWIVRSGAKGKPANISNLLSAPLLFADAKNRLIPIPILSGYAKGLSPSEYWASSYGTRKGYIDMKLSVADAGFLSKQLVQIAHRSVVTDDDDPENPGDETRGLPVDVNDDDNIGALLARSAGGYGRDTIITAKVLRDLKRQGVKRLLVRSPIVGGPQDGSIYAKDAGLRETGRLSVRGENPGVSAAQALSEPLSQAQLSSKHCLAMWTQVKMWDGTHKLVKDIKPGDIVVGIDDFDRNDGFGSKAIPAKVTAVYDHGIAQVHHLPISRDGLDFIFLDATAKHSLIAWYHGYPDDPYATSYALEETLEDVIAGESYLSIPIYEWVWPKKGRAEDRESFPLNFSTQDVWWNDLEGRKRLTQTADAHVYDIEIDTPNRMFMLANGIFVHNSAGVAGNSAGAIAGFKVINQLIQVPKEGSNWASHARKDGLVQRIEKAPQGGSYVYIENDPVYVAPGREVTVKPGDEIEAGDIISGGLPNPAAVVEHKGIGEGRRYFTQTLFKVLKDSGININRRNVELIARGLVNHVELDEEMDAYVPGDNVPYNMLERFYQPREDAQETSAANAVGKYLERPVLHYTIGTKIRPSVQRDLEEFGLGDKVLVHNDPPPFRSKMVRGMAIAANDPDWIASMQGSGIKSRVMEAVHRGHHSDPKGTSYVSGVVADTNFAQPGRGGKIEAPLQRLDEMKRKRREAPANPFEFDDDDD